MDPEKKRGCGNNHLSKADFLHHHIKHETPGYPHTSNPPTPNATTSAPINIVETNDHKILLHKTTYHVNPWKTDKLATKQIYHHIRNGLAPKNLTRVHPEDEDTPILSLPFEVTWKATWFTEYCVKALPNGNTTILIYTQNKPPRRKNSKRCP